MHRDVDVVTVPRVNIHSMEASTGAIDDLEPLSLLYGQVHQQRAVREVSKGLWGKRRLREESAGAEPSNVLKAEAAITLKAINLW